MARAGAIRAGRAFIEVFADNSKLRRGLRRAQARLQAFGSKVRAMSASLAKTGALLAAPLAYATKVFAGFDDEMRKVQAVTGSTGEAFDALTEKAKVLGRTTSYTASQVAGAMVELGRAGFSPDEIDAAIGSMLNLARATGTEIAEAANIAAASLRSFGLEAGEMTRVADVMVATANNSAQTLEDLGESMKYAAPVADSFGLTLEDTTKALGALANFGIKGSQAGTTLKNIMLQLAKADVRKQVEGMGVAVTDAQGNFRGLGDILTDLGAAMADMPQADRLALMSELFLKRAVAGGVKLTAKSFDELNQAIDGAEGTAAATAETMDAGIGGMFRRLGSAIEGVTLAVGEGLAPVLEQLGAWLTPLTTKMAAWLEQNAWLVKLVAGITAGLLGLSVAMLAVGVAFSGAAKMIALAGVALKAVGAILSFLMSPLGLVIGLFVGLGAVILTQTKAGGKALDWLGGKLGILAGESQRAFGAIAKALAHGRIGKAAEVFWAYLKLQWTRGVNFLKELWERFTYWLDKWSMKAAFWILGAWEHVKSWFKQFWIYLEYGFKAVWSHVKEQHGKLVENIGRQLANAWTRAQEAMGRMSKEEADFRVEYHNQSANDAIARIEREQDRARRRARRDAGRRRDDVRQDKRNALDAIDRAERQYMADRRRERDADIRALRAEVAAKKRALDDAIGGVENLDFGEDGAPGPGAAPPPPDLQETIANIRDQMRGMSGELAHAAGSTFSVRGTFSPSALNALAAGGPASAIEQNTREIAENTRRIHEGVEDGLPPRFQ